MLKEPPVTDARVVPWRADDPLWPLQQQLERFYNSRYAADLAFGDAVSASYGTHTYGPQQPGAPGRRTEARHVALVHRALAVHAETFPLHLRLYALPALDHIHHEWAAAIRCCYLGGQPVPVYAQIVRVRGVSTASVQRWLERGLQAVIEQLYTRDGHQQIPAWAEAEGR